MTKYKKNRILLLLTRLPYPPTSGERQKNAKLIQILKKHHDVKVLCITLSPPSKGDQAAFHQTNKDVDIEIIVVSRVSMLIGALKAFFKGVPLQVGFFQSKKAREKVKELQKKADLVLVNLIRLAEFSSVIPKPKILDLHDSIGQNYKRSYQNTASSIHKLYYKIEADRLIKYEKESIDRFDCTWMFNQNECDFYAKPAKTNVIPHGTKDRLLDLEAPGPSNDKPVLSFLGKMDYQPNIDAVVWFVKNVMPLISAPCTLEVLGVAPTPTIYALRKLDQRVNIVGFVDDPYPIVQHSACFIAPMISGGGIQNKILEAMACKSLVLTSTIGFSPLKDVEEGKHLLVANTPQQWAAALNEILVQPRDAKYESIRNEARAYIKSTYTWDHFENSVLESIEDVTTKQEQRYQC